MLESGLIDCAILGRPLWVVNVPARNETWSAERQLPADMQRAESDALLYSIAFGCQAGIAHGVDGREAVQGTGMVGWILRTRAKRKRGALAIEMLLIGQPGFVFALHVIPFHFGPAVS